MSAEAAAKEAGRHLWVGIPGPVLEGATAAHLRAVAPGGIVLFRRNIADTEQARRLVRDLKDLLGPDLHIAVDQEGGLVARFFRELTPFPGNMALGAAGMREPSFAEHLAQEQGRWMGRELADLGVTVNLAPVLDLASEGRNPSAGIRSFGEHPELASRIGAALVQGLLEGGVLPAAKHFPGLGDATVDSHLDLPTIREGDRAPHLRPFRAAIEADCPIVMTSHVRYPAFDADAPATLSLPIATGLLRDQLGFRGVTMTDDLEMGAMARHFLAGDMVRRAFLAGHDVLCICHSAELQAQAAATLARAIADEPDAARCHARSLERLDELVPRVAPGPPDRVRSDAVADAIAGRAVTVVRDDRGLLPLPKGRRALLLLPTLAGETMVEDPLRGEETGDTLVAALGDAVDLHRLPADPTEQDATAAMLRATSYARVLAVLTNARVLEGQARLAAALVERHAGAVLLPIRNPFDLEVLPVGARYSAVLPYGFRAPQLLALARVLLGSVQPYGRLPVTLRPRGA